MYLPKSILSIYALNLPQHNQHIPRLNRQKIIRLKIHPRIRQFLNLEMPKQHTEQNPEFQHGELRAYTTPHQSIHIFRGHSALPKHALGPSANVSMGAARGSNLILPSSCSSSHRSGRKTSRSLCLWPHMREVLLPVRLLSSMGIAGEVKLGPTG